MCARAYAIFGLLVAASVLFLASAAVAGLLQLRENKRPATPMMIRRIIVQPTTEDSARGFQPGPILPPPPPPPLQAQNSWRGGSVSPLPSPNGIDDADGGAQGSNNITSHPRRRSFMSHYRPYTAGRSLTHHRLSSSSSSSSSLRRAVLGEASREPDQPPPPSHQTTTRKEKPGSRFPARWRDITRTRPQAAPEISWPLQRPAVPQMIMTNDAARS